MIICFSCPLFISHEPLVSICPPLSLFSVALQTLVRLYLPLPQPCILPDCPCADIWPPGSHLCRHLLFRSALACICAHQHYPIADLLVNHFVHTCVDLILWGQTWSPKFSHAHHYLSWIPLICVFVVHESPQSTIIWHLFPLCQYFGCHWTLVTGLLLFR